MLEDIVNIVQNLLSRNCRCFVHVLSYFFGTIVETFSDYYFFIELTRDLLF